MIAGRADGWPGRIVVPFIRYSHAREVIVLPSYRPSSKERPLSPGDAFVVREKSTAVVHGTPCHASSARCTVSIQRPMRPIALLPLAGLLLASPAFADLPGPQFRFEYKIMPGTGDCPRQPDAETIFVAYFTYRPFLPDAKNRFRLVARRIPGKNGR